MPVDPLDKSNKWEAVRLAIRGAEVNGVKLHEKTPIIFLGGHSHIRNCNKPDDYSMSLQSGRFMETIGVKLPGVGGKPTFSRKYLDANTVTYERIVPYIKLPDIINSIVPTQAKNVDLIFLDYLWDQRKSGNILTILNTLGGNYKSTDAKVYSNIPSNEAIRIYAEAKWKPSEN
ncbi:hypothetical protein C0991_003015 [Blastosporella zonata]|nr:hypothetical protein C0991_003015 [Blastosporella zonata]